MSKLGVNVAGRAEQSPKDIAAIGATWCRAVALPEADLRTWIHGCHDAGIKVMLVLARESIGDDPNNWSTRITAFKDLYWGLVDAWQIGNEPDQQSPSSWTMKAADLNRLLATARQVLGPTAYIVGPGLASGQPSWVQHIDLDLIDALAFHPYTKFPGTVELDRMIAGYQAAANGRPLWITEYDSRTLGMATALRDDPRIEVALAFCMSNSMVQGFGLIENPPALADYLLATGGPLAKPPTPPVVPPPPPQDPYWVGQGLRAVMSARGDFAIGKEDYLTDNLSVAPGDKALYWWTAASRTVRVVPWEKP